MKHLNTLRRIRIAVAALVMLTICLAFLDYRDWVPYGIKHTITNIQFIPAYLSFSHGIWLGVACLVILLVSFCFGRIYCSVICPLGILQDMILRVANFLRRKKRFLGYQKPWNKLRYSILIAVIASIFIGWSGLVLQWLDPYSQFGRIAGTLFRPLAIGSNNLLADLCQHFQLGVIPRVHVPWVGLGVFLPILAIAVVLIIMAAWHGRLYCNTICPVGALLGLASKFSPWKLGIDKVACRKCGDCLRSCKAQCIDLRSGDIDFSRCVTCFNCISVCDEHGIKYRFHNPWRKKDPLTAKHNLSQEDSPRQLHNTRQNQHPTADLPLPDRRQFINATVTGLLALSGASSLLAKPGQGRGSGKPAASGFIEAVMPPGAQHLNRFLSHCTACQLCVSACPSHVLESSLLEYHAISGFMKPRLNYDKSFCNINCTVCGDVCPDFALIPLSHAEKQVTRIGLAKVQPHDCIIYKDGTDCGACAEHCPTAALQIKPLAGYPDPMPVVDEHYCIGCGACQFACPARPHKAITVHGLAQHDVAQILKQDKVGSPAHQDFPF